MLDNIDQQIMDAESEEGRNSFTVKDLVKLKQRKRQKLEGLLDRRKDEAVLFEQMGIDALLVDEVHAYKRSEFYTKLNRVKGIDSGSSQRSTSLILKSEFIRSKNRWVYVQTYEINERFNNVGYTITYLTDGDGNFLTDADGQLMIEET